jgi:acyl dehydratase
MEVEVGQEVPPFVVDPVRNDPMKTVAALLNDSNTIHWDVEAVKELGMGDRPVNQGTNNLVYVINMLVAWADGDNAALRRIQCRFLGNVFGGDTVTARGVVTAVREVDGERLADLDVWLERSSDDRVLAGTATVAIP